MTTGCAGGVTTGGKVLVPPAARGGVTTGGKVWITTGVGGGWATTGIGKGWVTIGVAGAAIATCICAGVGSVASGLAAD